MTLTIRAFEEGDEHHIVALNSLHDPHRSMTVDDVKAQRKRRKAGAAKYKHEAFLAFAGDRLLGSLTYFQPMYSYHPQKFCLMSRLSPGVPYEQCGLDLYAAVVDALAPFEPTALNAWARDWQHGFLAHLSAENYTERHRTVHMTLDVVSVAPRGTNPPDGVRILSLAEFAQDPQHLEKFYALDASTSCDVPGQENAVPPTFDDFKQNMVQPDFNWRGAFVALCGDELVGFSNMMENRGSKTLHLCGTGVLRAYRGRGIAAALKARCHRYAVDAGFREIHSDNHVTNPAIIATNRRCGFTTRWEEMELEKTVKKGS